MRETDENNRAVTDTIQLPVIRLGNRVVVETEYFLSLNSVMTLGKKEVNRISLSKGVMGSEVESQGR
jgi:hypothetical protein